jgi:hypothetical protein
VTLPSQETSQLTDLEQKGRRMGSPITESSSVVCGHSGTVQLLASQSKLTVAGSKVLVDGDLAGKPIASCTTVPSSTSVTCATVLTILPGGVAQKLTVGGKGVLLDSIQGTTSGTIGGAPQTWSVQSVGQTKLQTA